VNNFVPDAIGNKLSDALSGAMEGLGTKSESKDEDYDFNAHFQ